MKAICYQISTRKCLGHALNAHVTCTSKKLTPENVPDMSQMLHHVTWSFKWEINIELCLYWLDMIK